MRGTTGEITFKPSRCSCAQPLLRVQNMIYAGKQAEESDTIFPDRCFKYCWCLSPPEHKEQISPRPRGKPPQYQAALKGPEKASEVSSCPPATQQ